MKNLIIMVVIAGLAAVAGSVIVGSRSFDGTVTDNPYEKGLMWDQIQKKKTELGWRVAVENKEFVAGKNDIIISVFDKNGEPLDDPAVTVMLSRPSSSDYDKILETMKLQDGFYRALVDIPLHGYWDIKISVTTGGNNLLFEERIFAESEVK